MVASLLLRTLAVAGTLSGAALEARLALPYAMLHPIIEEFISSQFVDVTGYSAEPSVEGQSSYRVRMNHMISSMGRQRAAELSMVQSHYLGPCPISLEHYAALARGQAGRRTAVGQAELRNAVSGLEIDSRVLDEIGSAVASRSSMFIYGAPGNGKSTIARSIAQLLGEPIDVPYAVAVGDEIIRFLDPVFHRRADVAQSSDLRLQRVHRPLVRAGGELQLSQLELTYDRDGRYYEASLQWKANGGLLVIDDFGRQAESPARLLNRFIVPMEEGIDYLDLSATGHKIGLPFTCQVIFSTNLLPAELVDEAFLRRIAYKVLIPDPTPDAYGRIFMTECERNQLVPTNDALPFLLDLYKGAPLRGSHPSQLIGRILDRAAYLRQKPQVTREMVGAAFNSYLNPAFKGRETASAEPGAR